MSFRRAFAVGAVATALLLLAPGAVRAAEVPKLVARVNDYAALLSDGHRRELESRLEQYERRTGHQLALLTIPSLNGDPIEDYSIRVAEEWRLGDKSRDDGVIFVVARNDRKMRIEVGYGLEGVIPDVVAKRILDERVTPHFRQGDFAGGIDSAFEALMTAAQGEALGPSPSSSAERSPAPRGGSWRGAFMLLAMLAFFGSMFLRKLAFLIPAFFFAFLGSSIAGIPGAIVGFCIGLAVGLGGGGGGGGGYRRRGGGIWFVGGGHSGSFGGFSGGGFSGGGFSGGGGGFGGGGASGSW